MSDNDKDNSGILLPEGAEVKSEIIIHFTAPDSVEFSFHAGRTTFQQWLVAAQALNEFTPGEGSSEIHIRFQDVGSARYEISADALPLRGQIISAREWLDWRAKFFLSMSEAQKQQAAQAEMVKRMQLVQKLGQQRRPM